MGSLECHLAWTGHPRFARTRACEGSVSPTLYSRLLEREGAHPTPDQLNSLRGLRAKRNVDGFLLNCERFHMSQRYAAESEGAAHATVPSLRQERPLKENGQWDAVTDAHHYLPHMPHARCV